MVKTNFVHLHLYKLSEKLADEIWKIMRLSTGYGAPTRGDFCPRRKSMIWFR